MVVTNYYAMADGMMIGESTGGVMRNYITDAIGSVVGTVLNGVAENTYQYKPYGGVLAKTGTAPDPSFLWNGKSGYRATGLPNAEYYVRGRIVSSTTAQWTTVDILWPIERPYVFCNGSPVTFVDPSGKGNPTCYNVYGSGSITCNVYKGNNWIGKKTYPLGFTFRTCPHDVRLIGSCTGSSTATGTVSGYNCSRSQEINRTSLKLSGCDCVVLYPCCDLRRRTVLNDLTESFERMYDYSQHFSCECICNPNWATNFWIECTYTITRTVHCYELIQTVSSQPSAKMDADFTGFLIPSDSEASSL